MKTEDLYNWIEGVYASQTQLKLDHIQKKIGSFLLIPIYRTESFETYQICAPKRDQLPLEL